MFSTDRPGSMAHHDLTCLSICEDSSLPNCMRRLVVDLVLTPVVLPKNDKVEPWDYDRKRYGKRNEVERLTSKGIQKNLHAF